MIVDVELQTNEIDLYGIPPTVSGGGGAVDSVNGLTGVVVLDQDEIPDGTTYKQYSQTEKTKLAGIATAATANSADATLLDRANHTGSQTASTISDFDTSADARATTIVNARLSDANATDLTDGGDTTLHIHDSRYYTEAETDALLATKKTSFGMKAGKVDGGSVRDYTMLGATIPNTSGTGVPSTNRWNFEPHVLLDTVTLDRVALEVTTAGAAGKLARIAIYAADDYWQPATLIQDFGTVPVDPEAVPALQVITISPTLTLPPGRYMTVWATDGGATYRRVSGWSLGHLGLSGIAGATPLRTQYSSLNGTGTVASGFAAVSPRWERDLYTTSGQIINYVRYREV